NDHVYEEGHAFVVGGAGDDWIDSYGDGAVIAFNHGDGNDTIYAAQGSLVLSLGGISVPDLGLRQDGLDLVLVMPDGDSIRLTRQLEADPAAWPQITLQLFGSVHSYDFNGVIADFNSFQDPSLFLPLDGVLQQREIGVSEEEALGGALAWAYANEGSTSTLTVEEIRSVLSSVDFGVVPQSISLNP